MSDKHRTTLPPWTWPEVAGAVLGAVAVLADWVGDDFHWQEHSTIEQIGYSLLAIVGNAGGAWVLLAVLVAYLCNRRSPTQGTSVAAGAIFDVIYF